VTASTTLFRHRKYHLKELLEHLQACTNIKQVMRSPAYHMRIVANIYSQVLGKQPSSVDRPQACVKGVHIFAAHICMHAAPSRTAAVLIRSCSGSQAAAWPKWAPRNAGL
jgi:hypothetical protein